MAYMGGSLYYNPEDPSGSPVVPGARIAFRLGRVERVEVADNQFVFKDQPESARLGVIDVSTVDAQHVEFRYTLYGQTEGRTEAGSATLGSGESFDFDADGVTDVSYLFPASTRPGFATARFLTFTSSQEDQTTSMFAVVPSQYPGQEYPNGVMGINPDGRFLVAKYQTHSQARSVVRGVVSGDFVLDSLTGRYLRVTKSASSGARTFDDQELQTVDASIPLDLSFRIEEFHDSLRAGSLLLAIPYEVRGYVSESPGESEAVDALNALLLDPNLISRLQAVREIPIPAEALPAVLASIPGLDTEQLLQLNRLFLEKSYPELSPQVDNAENPLSEILPLLACEIRNPDAPSDAPSGETSDSSSGRSVSSATTAKTPSEYETQKTAIEETWAEYMPIVAFDLGPNGGKITNVICDFLASGMPQKIGDAAGGLVNLITSQFMGKTPPQPKAQPTENIQVFPVEADGTVKPEIQTPGGVFSNSFEVDPNGNIPTWESLTKAFVKPDQTWKMSLGLYGSFSISWGNMEAGLGVAFFIQADTKFIASAISDPEKTIGIAGDGDLISYTQPNTIPLDLGSLPPIQVGVVSFVFSLKGGFEVPVELGASMDMSLGLRFAFTGLYGAQVRFGVNYGVKWKTKKIGWWEIPYRAAPFANLYGKGSVIDETAFYLGPSEFLLAKSMVPWVDSAGVFVAVTPALYIEPRTGLNGILWAGLKGSVGDMRRLDIKTKGVRIGTNNAPYLNVYGTVTTKPVVRLDATYGATVEIPYVGWKLSESNSFNLWKSDLPSKTETLFGGN